MAPNNGYNTSEPTKTNWDTNENRVFSTPPIEKINNDSKLDIRFLLQDSFNRIHRHQRHRVLSVVSGLTKDQNWCTETQRYKLLPPLTSRFSGKLKNYVANRLDEILKKAGMYDEYYKYQKNHFKLERGIPTKNLSNSDYEYLIEQYEKRVEESDKRKILNRQKAKMKYAERWGITAHIVNRNKNLVSHSLSDKFGMGDGCLDSLDSKQGGCGAVQVAPADPFAPSLDEYTQTEFETQNAAIDTSDLRKVVIKQQPLFPISKFKTVSIDSHPVVTVSKSVYIGSSDRDRITETAPIKTLELRVDDIECTELDSFKKDIDLSRSLSAGSSGKDENKMKEDASPNLIDWPWSRHKSWLSVDYGPIPSHGPLFETDRFGQQVVVATLRFDWNEIEVDFYNANVLLYGRRNAIARRPGNFKVKDILGHEYKCDDLLLTGYTREYSNFSIEMARARNYVFHDDERKFEVAFPYDYLEGIEICLPQHLPWFETDVEVVTNVKDIGRFFTFAGCPKNDWKKFHCDIVLDKENSKLFVERFMSPHRTPT